MAEIVKINEEKLDLKLTQYGKDRITYAMQHPDVNLAITKIRIGSGRDNQYYEIEDWMLKDKNFDLQGPIGNYEFYILDKQLLEDELTVSFHAIIPEDAGGFDIREVGLYETVPGNKGPEDHLFAIATQQPFVKPRYQDNYFISLNYYIFLKAQNLADVYDRITLDIEHAAVSEPDLEAMMKTFLFAQENLMTQIGKNTELIGYNRPTQLLEKINENKTNYSYITLYKNFASVLDLVKSPDDIFSYWIFDYSRRESLGKSITDLSNNKYYLSTNKLSNLYPHTFEGFQSMFEFGKNDYFQLSSLIPVDLYNPETDMDSPFTMVFALEPNSYTENRTLLAKSNRGENQESIFEIQELNDRSLRMALYSENGASLTFKSAPNIIPYGAHALIITYDPVLREVKAFVDSNSYSLSCTPAGNYTHMNASAGAIGGIFYEYEYLPSIYAAKDTSYSDDPQPPTSSPLSYNDSTETDTTIYCNPNGTPVGNSEPWMYDSHNLHYHNIIADVKSTLYAWTYDDKIIYTMENPITSTTTVLYNRDFTRVSQSQESFHITQEGAEEPYTYKLKYGENEMTYTESENINYSPTPINLYAWTTEEIPGVAQKFIYTTDKTITSINTPLYDIDFNTVEQSDDSFHIVAEGSTFKIVYGDDGEDTSISYDNSKIRWLFECVCPAELKVIYTTTNNIQGLAYPLYTLENDVFEQYVGTDWTFQSRGSGKDITYVLCYDNHESTFTGNYVDSPIPPLASYIIGADGSNIEPINSKVGLISIIKEKLSDADARVLALNLCATMGQNPFLSGD